MRLDNHSLIIKVYDLFTSLTLIVGLVIWIIIENEATREKD